MLICWSFFLLKRIAKSKGMAFTTLGYSRLKNSTSLAPFHKELRFYIPYSSLQSNPIVVFHLALRYLSGNQKADRQTQSLVF